MPYNLEQTANSAEDSHRTQSPVNNSSKHIMSLSSIVDNSYQLVLGGRSATSDTQKASLGVLKSAVQGASERDRKLPYANVAGASTVPKVSARVEQSANNDLNDSPSQDNDDCVRNNNHGTSKFDVFGNFLTPKPNQDDFIDFESSNAQPANMSFQPWTEHKKNLFRNGAMVHRRTGSGISSTNSETSIPNKPTPEKKEKLKKILGSNNWRSEPPPSSKPFIQSRVKLPQDAEIENALLAVATDIPHHVREVHKAIQQHREVAENENDITASQSFRPSFSALQKIGLLPGLDAIRSAVSANEYGGSENYLGDMSLLQNRSANIPDELNCALWILGLPARTTYADLLGSIRGVGKVFASVINPPCGNHATSAAKIVFFDRSSAERLFQKIVARDFIVGGQIVSDVRWNKIKARSSSNKEQSRVICITGPEALLSFDYFKSFFDYRFTYDLDQRRAVLCAVDGFATHEWHFSSVRCQSASAKTAIERELSDVFHVQWARDPCDI